MAFTLNNLAALYRAQSRYKEAEPLYLDSLHLLGEASGAASLDVGRGLHNLAELYRAEGKYCSAETAAARSVEISERISPQGEATAASLFTLAAVKRDRSRYDEALSLLERSLEDSGDGAGPVAPAGGGHRGQYGRDL